MPDPTKPDAAALAAEIERLMFAYMSAARVCADRATDQNVKGVRRAEDAMWAAINLLVALAQRSESAGEIAEVNEARERFELSEDEIMECWEGCSDPAHPEVSIIALARAIERRLAKRDAASQAAQREEDRR